MKGGYDHYMQKEIHEQPESVLQTMRGRVKFSSVPKVCWVAHLNETYESYYGLIVLYCTPTFAELCAAKIRPAEHLLTWKLLSSKPCINHNK